MTYANVVEQIVHYRVAVLVLLVGTTLAGRHALQDPEKNARERSTKMKAARRLPTRILCTPATVHTPSLRPSTDSGFDALAASSAFFAAASSLLERHSNFDFTSRMMKGWLFRDDGQTHRRRCSSRRSLSSAAAKSLAKISPRFVSKLDASSKYSSAKEANGLSVAHRLGLRLCVGRKSSATSANPSLPYRLAD